MNENAKTMNENARRARNENANRTMNENADIKNANANPQ